MHTPTTGIGGIFYWVPIFPVDCIKSAMQTDNINKSQRKYTDFVTTAKVCLILFERSCCS